MHHITRKESLRIMFQRFRKLYMNNKYIYIRFIRNSIRKAFEKNLLFTNVVSTGVLCGVADLIQQEIECRQQLIPERYDYARTGRMFLVGLALGPMTHYYYKYLDTFFPKLDLTTIAKKILTDQLIASPFFIASFFSMIGILEMKTYHEIKAELSDKFLTVYTFDWCVWPPIQFINFYYINPKYRVLYINFVMIIYDVFLSYVKHKEHERIPIIVGK